jgi:hypothetical protein
MNTIRIIKTKKPLPATVKSLIIVALFLLLTAIIASAQTNAPASPPLPDSTAADWAKALGDLGFHVTAAQISLVILIGLPFVKAAAGYLRKAIPKAAQVNQAGIVLAHVAGVDNPTLESLQAEIPKPAVPEKPPTIKDSSTVAPEAAAKP